MKRLESWALATAQELISSSQQRKRTDVSDPDGKTPQVFIGRWKRKWNEFKATVVQACRRSHAPVRRVSWASEDEILRPASYFLSRHRHRQTEEQRAGVSFNFGLWGFCTQHQCLQVSRHRCCTSNPLTKTIIQLKFYRFFGFIFNYFWAYLLFKLTTRGQLS